MPTPKLIITADDYGMSPRFNQGIIEAVQAGLITGISIMIYRKYIRSKELLRTRLPLGLHLEIQDDAPYQEITHQIERFKKRFGRLPDYLDGHQHKHITEKNIRRVARAAKQFGLPVRSRLPEDRMILTEIAVPTPENFVSWHPARLAVLKERLQQTKKFSISELVVHPGYRDKRCRYRYNNEREKELEFLCSPRFRKLIQSFRLVGYNGLINPTADVRAATRSTTRKRAAKKAIRA